MTIVLTLLGDVRWRGNPVAGDRPQALLAALAEHECRTVGQSALIELVWGDDAPSNGTKSLQVLVSRARSACGPEVIVRDGAGYRLGVSPDEVDGIRLSRLVREAAAALDTEAGRAAGLAREALTLVDGLVRVAHDEAGPLADLRRAAAEDAATARLLLARAASRTGAHADALAELESAHAGSPHDEALLADLLRSEAAVRGTAVALERYENYRQGVRQRLGADPGAEVRRAHRALLAQDRPVRRGVHFDATELIGRDCDIERLTTMLANARVVSIVGPGGLGKTRLAHVLARAATQPAVHLVELAGVTAAEDVATEVESVLGAHDAVGSRRPRTAQQPSDIRARIARRLAQAPGLLVLDNCEHLIEAAADLVAFLIAATPDLRILTTSRAPLAIAAERVYLLGELDAADAAELFRERASAARPDVRLDERVVARIVGRLDGLPLAVELAAAKVRIMAVEEIDRRLEDRFALLRGGDRSAPDRHQALLTVIEWSWNLLDAAQRRALRRLSLFHDGFALEAAEAMLGPGAVEAVLGLVDQSLLAVKETGAGVRYRMLETVREFGWRRLEEAGEQAEARTALRRWAADFARAHSLSVTADQYSAVDALRAEETNLSDELRAAIADGDRESLACLLATLGVFWTMRGDHLRLLAIARTVSDALRDWTPPPELEDTARAAVAIALSSVMMTTGDRDEPLLGLMKRLGPATGSDAYVAGLYRVMLAYGETEAGGFTALLADLAEDPDRRTAIAAGLWLAHERENEGDPLAARQAAEHALALTGEHDSWLTAMPHMLLAQLNMDLGDRAAATAHAEAALPVMQRLGAGDDEMQLRALLVLVSIAEGRLADAKDQLARAESINESFGPLGSGAFRYICRAELLLASGEIEQGLHLYRSGAEGMRDIELPGVSRTGVEPWSLFGDALALSSHAWYARDEDVALGRAMFFACRAGALRVFSPENERPDFPASGLLLFGLGAWGLLRKAAPVRDALRMLALAQRFAYNRMIPTMLWERITPVAEQAAPGVLAELQARYADLRPPDLMDEARRAARRLPDGGA